MTSEIQSVQNKNKENSENMRQKKMQYFKISKRSGSLQNLILHKDNSAGVFRLAKFIRYNLICRQVDIFKRLKL